MRINPFQKNVVSVKEYLRNTKFENILKCVHCGLCLDSCPTYRELQDEKDSPRGRLYLMRGLWEGELKMESSVIEPLNRCLDCRACETACPSGVPYGELLEKTRSIILENTPQSLKSQILRIIFFKVFFRYTSLMVIVSRLIKIYMDFGFPKLITNTFVSKILPKSFVFQQYLIPNFSGKSFKRKHAEQIFLPIPKKGIKENNSKNQEKSIKVGMFSGCIMDVSEAKIHEATLTMLRHIGCEVVIPSNQVCCGALHVHNGDRKTARELAIQNFRIFKNEQLDGIITNAAGCGAQLKEYHLLFSEKKAIKRDNFSEFEEKIFDVMEFLSNYSKKLKILDWRRDEDIVLYDAPCHLIHAQKVDKNLRELLNSLPGVTLISIDDSDWCCGSAGIYNLTQPKLSAAILNRKTQSILKTLTDNSKVKTLLTGNPGCLYQLRAGISSKKIDLHVVHPIVYLADRLKKNES